MTADEILHQVWLELHRTAHSTHGYEEHGVLSEHEARLYDHLTKRLLKTFEGEKPAE